jgi:hypothetical protein
MGGSWFWQCVTYNYVTTLLNLFIYLFICNLFSNVVSSSDYIASNYGMISEKLIAFVHFIVIEKLIVYFEVSIKDLY